MGTGLFKNVTNKLLIYKYFNIYSYKQDFALNNLPR